MTVSKTSRYKFYIASAIFVVTSIQLTFLSPYVVLVPGERANVFSGMLCFFSFLAALFLVPRAGIKIRSWEVAVSVALVLFASGSAFLSVTPASSGWRAFVIMSSSLGGYWCARLLLKSVEIRKGFVYLCLGLMLGSCFLFFLGLQLTGLGYRFMDVGYHAISSRVIVLSFAPIALIASAGQTGFIIGAVTLVIGYITLLANLVWGGVSTGPVIPIIVFLVGMLFLWKVTKIRKILVAALAGCTILVAIFSSVIVNDLPKESQSVAYRIENIFFSAHIAMRHPFFGIGPFAPRTALLEDYEVKYPFVTNERFFRMTRTVITSENLPLTLIAEFGLPFSFIYFVAVGFVLFRMFKLVKADEGSFYPHPLALFLPALAMVIQFQIFDGIYHPQISWFFHIMLGMAFMDEQNV